MNRRAVGWYIGLLVLAVLAGFFIDPIDQFLTSILE